MSDLSWLWSEDEKPQDEEEGLKLSEGGIDFQRHYVGQWGCAVMHRITADPGVNLDELQIKYSGRDTVPFGEFYYFAPKLYDEAVKAKNDLGLQYGPQQMWHWELPSLGMMNFKSGEKSATEVFGDTISFDVAVTGWGSKNRHAFHLMTLPSVIQAIAIQAGFLKEMVYDYEKLSVQPENAGYEEMVALIGDPTERDSESENHFTKSELFRARQKLWAALGEDNPMAYTRGGKGDYEIESQVLTTLMGIVYLPQTKIWTDFLEVWDPRHDAISASGNRYRCYVAKTVFKDEATARASIPEEETTNNGSNNNVPIPSGDWAQADSADWISFAKEYLENLGIYGKPDAIVKKKLVGEADEDGMIENAAATVDDFVAINNYMKE